MNFDNNTLEFEGVAHAQLVQGANSGSYARQVGAPMATLVVRANPRAEGTDFGHTLQNDPFSYSGNSYPAIGPAYTPEIVCEPEQMDCHNDIRWDEWIHGDPQGEEYWGEYTKLFGHSPCKSEQQERRAL
ncbi:hypothetical protein JX265_002053 [Neoarthrinium moseri]|uniref:Uncharacterized protein n=1 Tax=Neoarthrinium moseri TaxID=1658444 RepID=A0A9P9WWE7_9PEZI|nr:hypothetical protein JX266_006162 [Neoarthrinium moseri]KAI1880432.1 hypothetical protein JX265_002053 [Neoarthrinium moseri]